MVFNAIYFHIFFYYEFHKNLITVHILQHKVDWKQFF